MLNLKKKEWIIQQKIKGKLTNQEIADSQGVSKRWIQNLWANHKQGLDILNEQPLGRKADSIPSMVKQAILEKRKQGFGIRKIEGLLALDAIKVSHNKIHRVLKEGGLVQPEPKKGIRRKYIRWERHHSNSLWQTDFCWQEKLQCWLIGYLDDHSRFIVGATYTRVATAEVAIKLFDKARDEYGNPREILSDRGTQFYAQRGEQSGFTKYLNEIGVNHIFASIKKPTTCGKLERFWLTHNKERWNFPSLKKFISYYNFERQHMSLNYLTPYEVFIRDLKGEVIMGHHNQE